jgi:hypothetical protein
MSSPKTIKISEEFMVLARREAEIMHRSVGRQVEYWAQLGRQIETLGVLNHERVKALLNGNGNVHDLSSSEDAALYVDMLTRQLEGLDGSDERILKDLRAGRHPVASEGKSGKVVIEKARARR